MTMTKEILFPDYLLLDIGGKLYKMKSISVYFFVHLVIEKYTKDLFVLCQIIRLDTIPKLV